MSLYGITTRYGSELHSEEMAKDGRRSEERDEGIFITESNGEDDYEDDDDDFSLRSEPKTEFEKTLYKLDLATSQIAEDTEMLQHDLKSIQIKNESTEKRILRLMREAAEFRSRLQGFLDSFPTRRRYRSDEVDEVVQVSHEDTLSSLPPMRHTASFKILLKQNSIEQPVHVNIAVR